MFYATIITKKELYLEKMKLIPLEIVNTLISNHSGLKKSLMQGSPINIQQKTKDAIMAIKRINGLSSASNAIDLLIATVMLYQIDDSSYDGTLTLYSKDQLKSNKGVPRSVIVEGKEYYTVYSVAKTYKVSRQTVLYRIRNTHSYRFRGWNYLGEDLKLKYMDN